MLFACLPGEHVDGHDFAEQAVERGAVAVLVDRVLERVPAPQIVVDDTTLRIGPISSLVWGDPSRTLLTVGITGTNGKTTTAQLVASILAAGGWPTGVLGTLHGTRTTPEAPDLHAALAGFVELDHQAAVLEVSSHALALHRVDGTRFDAAVFTNLGTDHLDLHHTTEAYFRAKARLFTPAFTDLAVINVGDVHGRLLADGVATLGGVRVVEFDLAELTNVEISAARHSYDWDGTHIDVAIGGRFNVANSLAAATVARQLGVPIDAIAAGLAQFPPVPGRFETIDVEGSRWRGVTIVVDYAHTPEGLAEVLESARQLVTTGSLTVVFGCGGERDRGKRPEMGAIAAALADRVVITSDNPRHEPPGAIIDDIVGGIDNADRGKLHTDPDRRDAIAAALRSAQIGDVIVVAGKGHERTQQIGDRMIDFDDRDIIRDLLDEAVSA
jgi:UDP-N-acetylmuramoyl-L-alanyl-D-glutamate--2,6-diaminopimelate ligase